MHKLSFFLLFLSVFFISCNSDGFEEHDLGSNLIDNSTEVRLIDTFTINASTVIIDSLATSGAATLTVGRYIDPYLGVVRSQGYTKIGLGGVFELEKNNVPEYDSIVFITYFAKSFYGDTTQFQTLSIHRVIEEIECNDDGKLYNVSSFDFDPNPLGERTFKARPNRKQDNGNAYNLRVHLSDEFGRELIELAKEHSAITSDAGEWENYLEGITLRSGDSDNAAILNYQAGDTLMKIRLYYHEISGENTDKVLSHDFPIGLSTYSFSNYTSDRTGTLLGNLVEQEFDISSTETGDLTFIQGGVGIMTKLKIPYLEELAKIGLSGSLLKAELVFRPEPGSYDDDLYPIPSSFNVYLTDEKNRILNALTNPVNGSVLTSLFFFDKEYEEESYFSFDITHYVNNVLVNGEDEDTGLLISLPSSMLSSSMDRVVLTNDKNTDFEFKIRATYVVQK